MRYLKGFFLLAFISVLTISCKSSSSSDDDDTGLDGLVWSDEFDGTTWSRDNWDPDLGASGWGNQELQDYTVSTNNLVISDGTMKIIAQKVSEGQSVGDYTSTRLKSIPAFGPGHRMEIRAKMPDLVGPGLWPAIWMLGDGCRNGVSWPECGEIDIMEYVSKVPNSFFATVHTGAFNHVDGTAQGSGDVSLPNIEEEFNVFGIEWTEDDIKFYVNDRNNVIFRFLKATNATNDEWPFDNSHFFILNMAVGGNFGGPEVNDDNFPATFEIDYVRVFELEEE
ncbi:MAG: glycoside hydrolase family 16 protein [Balneola sp.]|nr:MAG: glycoside hydrolase family 16 protein [Balneola sp.]